MIAVRRENDKVSKRSRSKYEESASSDRSKVEAQSKQVRGEYDEGSK
jgi:hypothetical protein